MSSIIAKNWPPKKKKARSLFLREPDFKIPEDQVILSQFSERIGAVEPLALCINLYRSSINFKQTLFVFIWNRLRAATWILKRSQAKYVVRQIKSDTECNVRSWLKNLEDCVRNECHKPRSTWKSRGPSFQDTINCASQGCWTQDEAGNHNTQESETFDGDDDDGPCIKVHLAFESLPRLRFCPRGTLAMP